MTVKESPKRPRSLAQYSWSQGDRTAVDRYMAEALDAVAEQPESRVRAAALRVQTGLLMLAGRFEEAILLGAEALPLIEALGMEEARARLHIVVGCARCCLGDSGGFDEIEIGISLAEQIGSPANVLGYGNLSSELHLLCEARGRAACVAPGVRARRALRPCSQPEERPGRGRVLGVPRRPLGRSACRRERRDREGRVRRPGVRRHVAARAACLDPPRTWRHGRSRRGQRRAADLGRGSDAQAQSHTFCVRAAVALAVGDRAEADPGRLRAP